MGECGPVGLELDYKVNLSHGRQDHVVIEHNAILFFSQFIIKFNAFYEKILSVSDDVISNCLKPKKM